jgi:hypothetical protein
LGLRSVCKQVDGALEITWAFERHRIETLYRKFILLHVDTSTNEIKGMESEDLVGNQVRTHDLNPHMEQVMVNYYGGPRVLIADWEKNIIRVGGYIPSIDEFIFNELPACERDDDPHDR